MSIRNILNKKAFILIISFLLANSCETGDSDRLLNVENYWFTTADFYFLHPVHTFKHLPENYKRERIESFIDRQLIVYKGIDEGYLKLPGFKEEYRRFQKRALINFYFDRTVLDSVVTKHRLLNRYESLDYDKRDLYTFDEYAAVLKERLIKEFSNEIQERYLKTVQNIKKASGFKSYPQNIEGLAKIYLDTYVSLRNDSVFYAPFDILKRLHFEKPVYQINGKDITLKKFITKIENFPLALPNQFSNPEVLNEIIEMVAINTYILKLAERLNFDRDPLYKQRLRNQKFSILYNLVIRDAVSRKISVSDDNIYQYYLDNVDSLYRTKEEFEVQEIFVKDQKLAEDILKKINRGEDFQQLADTFTERYQTKPRKGYLGFLRADMYGNIGRTAANIPPGQHCFEPIPSGKGFSIIKVLSVKESQPISFDDNRGKILEDYKDVSFKQKRAELIQALRDKYNYYVDYSKLIN